MTHNELDINRVNSRAGFTVARSQRATPPVLTGSVLTNAQLPKQL